MPWALSRDRRVTVAWLRPAADNDLVERTHHYRAAGGDDLGGRFFASAIAALRAIERVPGVGSPTPGERLGIDGLRAQRIRGFPCCWYYFERLNRLDVVRLLADAQDLPSWIGSADG